MFLARVILLMAAMTLTACGANEDATSSGGGDCAAAVGEAPAWKSAQTDATAIRIAGTDDVPARLAAQLQSHLQQSHPELGAQSTRTLVSLIVEDAHVETWVEPGTCATWSGITVDKQAVADEVVFLNLNEQLAREVPRFRELGGDVRKTDEERSGYLTTALLLLESIDTRYLARTLAVNYERELIQSRLDELSETFSADFEALLAQGLNSSNVAAAESARLSLEKFGSIDAAEQADGLQRMDELIVKLRTEGIRSEIDAIRRRGVAGGYLEAESAAVELERFADGEQGEYAGSVVSELRQRARVARVQEIEGDIDELQSADVDAAALQALNDRLDAFASIYPDASEVAGWRARLNTVRDAAAERASLAAQPDCSTAAELDTYTTFQFRETDFRFSARKQRKLAIETTSSEVTIASNGSAGVRVVGISQQLTGEDGGVISNGSVDPAAEVAAAGAFTTSIDLDFDNANPSAVACLGQLARRSHACVLAVVTQVRLEGPVGCPQTELTTTEKVRFESLHTPDNYTIKLRRNK